MNQSKGTTLSFIGPRITGKRRKVKRLWTMSGRLLRDSFLDWTFWEARSSVPAYWPALPSCSETKTTNNSNPKTNEKDKLSQRVSNLKGNLLVIRSTFTVKRSDFGINPDAPQDKVSNDIELTLSLAGASAR
jgi:hypothetical protein